MTNESSFKKDNVKFNSLLSHIVLYIAEYLFIVKLNKGKAEKE